MKMQSRSAGKNLFKNHGRRGETLLFLPDMLNPRDVFVCWLTILLFM